MQNPNVCGIFGIHEDNSYKEGKMKCCPVRTAILLMKENKRDQRKLVFLFGKIF